jgi:hypothetical protein
MAGIAAWMLRRLLGARQKAAPLQSASVSIEQGVRLLEAGMAEIKTAVAGIPIMQRAIAIQGTDIMVLQQRAHRADAEFSDIRREMEEMCATQRASELRIRHLERGK